MVNLYIRCVRAGLMTVEQVPLLWQERVREAIEKTENAQ